MRLALLFLLVMGVIELASALLTRHQKRTSSAAEPSPDTASQTSASAPVACEETE